MCDWYVTLLEPLSQEDELLEQQVIEEFDSMPNSFGASVSSKDTPPTCRVNDKNNAVLFLSRRLARLGYDVDSGGTMDERTVSAVTAEQTKHNLHPDGICGAKTWRVILNGGNGIVLYRQNDSAWKKIMYSSHNDPSQTIGNSGCGPSSLCTVLSMHLSTHVLPPVLCEYAVKNGYRTYNSGTKHEFFEPAAAKYGVRTEQTYSIDTVTYALDKGHVAIAVMGPGDYTKGGHYICLRDYDPYSAIFFTLDPASSERSSCDREVIKTQAKKYWIFKGQND